MLRAQESSPSLNPTLAFPATNREAGTLAKAGLCQTPTLVDGSFSNGYCGEI